MCKAILLLIAFGLLVAIPALANDTTLNVNVDPPQQLSGYDAVPIRMESEHITVHFGKQQSKVEVEFTFINEYHNPIACWAGFPDEDLLKRWMFYGPRDAQGNMPDYTFGGEALDGDYAGRDLDQGVLTDFKSWRRFATQTAKDNEPLDTVIERIERIAYEPKAISSLGGSWQPSENVTLNKLTFCHVFQLNFEVGEPVVIGHSYTTRTGSNVEQQHLFNYTLGTGRSWAGTIGKATIDVYLEDGIKYEDLNFTQNPDTYGALTSPAKADWKKIGPKHLQLVWNNFEPEGDQSYIMLATKPIGMKHD